MCIQRLCAEKENKNSSVPLKYRSKLIKNWAEERILQKRTGKKGERGISKSGRAYM